MIVLDTDHISILQHGDAEVATVLQERLARSPDGNVATTAVALEEQCRSWLGIIHRDADVRRQGPYYARFVDTFRFFAGWRVVPFNDAAAARFEELRSARVRIGSSDLKIAAMCPVNRAVLLSRNLADFRQVPGLHVEDWLGS